LASILGNYVTAGRRGGASHKVALASSYERRNRKLGARTPKSSQPFGELALYQKVAKGQAVELFGVEGLFAVRALALPRFAAFLDQKPKDSLVWARASGCA
jgi:hypothetical protein